MRNHLSSKVWIILTVAMVFMLSSIAITGGYASCISFKQGKQESI